MSAPCKCGHPKHTGSCPYMGIHCGCTGYVPVGPQIDLITSGIIASVRAACSGTLREETWRDLYERLSETNFE